MQFLTNTLQVENNNSILSVESVEEETDVSTLT
jgi:hypothetical protein